MPLFGGMKILESDDGVQVHIPSEDVDDFRMSMACVSGLPMLALKNNFIGRCCLVLAKILESKDSVPEELWMEAVRLDDLVGLGLKEEGMFEDVEAHEGTETEPESGEEEPDPATVGDASP